MFRTLPLLHELERRARALGFTWAALAAEVGIDRTTLAHIRSGRGRLSLGTLHRIAAWFPTDAAIQRCVWEYLLHDVETRKERTAREAMRSDSAEAYARTLSAPSVAVLRTFVAEFPSRAVSGSGLLLVSPGTSTLSAALGYLEAELHARRIHVLRRDANARVTASAISALVAAPVLLVDRIEHASSSMVTVLQSRATYLKVTVATSAALDTSPASLDPRLASRLLRTHVDSRGDG